MKKALIMAGALVAFAARAASAQSGINLAFSDCGVSGLAAKSFACDSNGGTPETLIASVVTGTDMPHLNGHAGVIDLQATGDISLPAWWDFGGCRAATSISANYNFTLGPLFTCLDPWQGAAAGSATYTAGFGSANRARFKTVCTIPGSVAISGSEEYYVFQIVIDHAKTTGTGACAGCTDGACIVLNSILMTQPVADHDDRSFTDAYNSQYVAWQSGGGFGGDCKGTPTRPTTWGSVKSLYR